MLASSQVEPHESDKIEKKSLAKKCHLYVSHLVPGVSTKVQSRVHDKMKKTTGTPSQGQNKKQTRLGDSSCIIKYEKWHFVFKVCVLLGFTIPPCPGLKKKLGVDIFFRIPLVQLQYIYFCIICRIDRGTGSTSFFLRVSPHVMSSRIITLDSRQRTLLQSQ